LGREGVLWGRDGSRAGRSLVQLRLNLKAGKEKHQQSSGDEGQWHFTAFVLGAMATRPSHYNTQLDALLIAEQ
jgi:hypothetical protein